MPFFKKKKAEEEPVQETPTVNVGNEEEEGDQQPKMSDKASMTFDYLVKYHSSIYAEMNMSYIYEHAILSELIEINKSIKELVEIAKSQ